jgi:hypothetical protein
VLEDGKIKNYQVITPTAWNIGPRDGRRPTWDRWSRPSSARRSSTRRTRSNSATSRTQLRLLPGVHGARVRRQDRLHLSAELAASRFPHDVLVAALDGSDLILVPLRSPANGGLVLRQRNAAGERTVLIHEVFDFAQVPGGTFDAEWDAARGALIVRLAGPFSGAGS